MPRRLRRRCRRAYHSQRCGETVSDARKCVWVELALTQDKCVAVVFSQDSLRSNRIGDALALALAGALPLCPAITTLEYGDGRFGWAFRCLRSHDKRRPHTVVYWSACARTRSKMSAPRR